MFRICSTAKFAFIAAAVVVTFSARVLWSQAPELAPFPAQVEEAPEADEEVAALTVEQLQNIERWVEELAASEFAVRERAATQLLEIGSPVIPQLRQVVQEASDAEVRLRAGAIVKRLTQGDMQARIDSFLAGEDVGFEGWRVTQAIIGDSDAIRELFIELMNTHPDLTASLEGTARDRALAMDKVVTQVQTRMNIERKFPTRANAFALLLPTVDPNVPLNNSFESLVLSVLEKDAASKIRRDAQLSAPFRFLLDRWVLRSTPKHREEVLLKGMEWDLEATLPLAIQTLGESEQTEVLAGALQAIAKFGTRVHAELVRPLLDDTRPSSESGFAQGEIIRTQLGDVAMATIAMLYDVPLKEIGFSEDAEHPSRGFLLSEIGFPVDAKEKRDKARATIDKLLANATRGIRQQ